MSPDETPAPFESPDLEVDAAMSAVLRLSEDGLPIDSGPNILDMLSPDELARLFAQGRETSYAPGDFFFQQGEPHDGIHFIRTGRVRSYYVSPGGREITLAYWPKGHFVGAPQILGGGEHMWT